MLSIGENMLPQKLEQIPRRQLADPAGVGRTNGVHGPAIEGPPKVELLKAIRRRPWLVLAAAMLALAIAFIYLSQTTPIYQASAKLDVQKNTPKLIAETVQQQQINTLYSDSQIIQSTSLLNDAVTSAQLDSLPTLRDSENPVAVLQESLKVDPDPQGQILTISLQSTRSEDAAIIVNAVVKAYIDYTDKRSQNSAASVLGMLQAEKTKREAELSDLQKKMLDFQRANGILSFEDSRSETETNSSHRMGNNIITTRLAELSDLHTKAEADLLSAQIAVDTADSMKGDPDQLRRWVKAQTWINASQNSSQNQSSALDAEIDKETVDLEDLEEQYGGSSSFPPVVKARRNLERLQQKEAASESSRVDDYLLVLRTQLLNAQQREKELGKQLDAQRTLAMNLNDKVAEYDQLSTDAARTERLLDIIDNRLKEVDVNSDTRAVINILESAKPPGSPFYPKRSRVLGIALVLGLMAGIAATVVFDRLDHRLRTTEEVSTMLGLPVLGIIPRIERRVHAVRRGQMVHHDPRSEVSEAYRTLRTALFFGAHSDSQTILITSPMPGDGKSLCASNLALALAQTDNNVLLIDCDTRKPVQHVQFAMPNTVGLSDVLAGKVELHRAIQTSPSERLDVLTCGKPPDNPAELLNSIDFRALLERLCGEYDKIVIDSPPLVPVTDARILSTIADVTVLVVRAERSTRRGIEHARDAVISVGGALVGAVVNDVPRNGFGYYYYGYKGGYRYGSRYGVQDSNGHKEGATPEHASNGNGKKHQLVT